MTEDELVRTIKSAPLSDVYDAWYRIDHHPYENVGQWYHFLQERNVVAFEVAERMVPLLIEARLKS